MHKFSPQNSERLEHEERYSLLQPEQTLRRFGLREGMTFLDIGAGTGFFSRAASKIVSGTGTVYAADISTEMITAFRRHGIPKNVHLIHSKEYHVPLQRADADVTLLAFVLHETPQIPKFLSEVKRLTRFGGHIAILEWKKQAEESGPPMEERIDPDSLRTHLRGFKVLEQADLNPSHYYCILQVV